MDDFTAFYLASRDRVFRTMVAVIGHRGDAEDAVAEAYARAFVRWSRLREYADPVGWVLVTALNTQRRRWRRIRRERLGAVPDAHSGAAPDQSAPADQPLPVELRRLVLGLPRRQREVVALRLVADVSTEQTARLLGIAPATVDVHLHRALAALRAQLRPAASRELTS
jgi:RNA polymerase sigma-70 factor (ECF subfamily)